jgi:hypothetical protein
VEAGDRHSGTHIGGVSTLLTSLKPSERQEAAQARWTALTNLRQQIELFQTFDAESADAEQRRGVVAEV